MKTNTIKNFIRLFFISILVSVFCFTSTSYATENTNNSSEYDKECCIDGITYGLTSYNHEASVKQTKCKEDDIHIPGSITFEGEDYIVTTVGQEAFTYAPYTSVTFPDTVTKIEKEAFAHSYVISVIFPQNSQLDTICDHAFSDSENLYSINFPENLTFIDAYAFRGCSGLSSITIPYNIRYVGERAFMKCDNLKSATFCGERTQIDGGVFTFCNQLKDMYFYSNYIIIDSDAFSGMNFNLHYFKGTSWDTSDMHLGNAKHINYVQFGFELSGQCYDCGLKLPIKNNEIQILDENDKVISTVYSDENGDYYKLFDNLVVKKIKVRTTYQGKTFTSKEISTDSNKHLNIVFN